MVSLGKSVSPAFSLQTCQRRVPNPIHILSRCVCADGIWFVQPNSADVLAHVPHAVIQSCTHVEGEGGGEGEGGQAVSLVLDDGHVGTQQPAEMVLVMRMASAASGDGQQSRHHGTAARAKALASLVADAGRFAEGWASPVP